MKTIAPRPQQAKLLQRRTEIEAELRVNRSQQLEMGKILKDSGQLRTPKRHARAKLEELEDRAAALQDELVDVARQLQDEQAAFIKSVTTAWQPKIREEAAELADALRVAIEKAERYR
jgi:16S rRNA C1402 N4-methylase RsmH